MTYKIKNKQKTGKVYQVDNDKKYTSQLKDVYSFSQTDNEIKKVYMTPDEFLRETYRESQQNNPDKYQTFEEYKKEVLFRNNVEGIKEVLTGMKKSPYKQPIPFLEYGKTGKVRGHEGRHTAQALKELGVKKIPVTIVKSKIFVN